MCTGNTDVVSPHDQSGGRRRTTLKRRLVRDARRNPNAEAWHYGEHRFGHLCHGRHDSWARSEDAVLFDPTRVRIERYWYRGTRIPSPYDPITTS